MTRFDTTITARIEHHGERMTELADERPLTAALHCAACVVWGCVGYAGGFWHRAAERERAKQEAVTQAAARHNFETWKGRVN